MIFISFMVLNFMECYESGTCVDVYRYFCGLYVLCFGILGDNLLIYIRFKQGFKLSGNYSQEDLKNRSNI